MKILFGTDHAGFELKETLLPFVRDELGHEVEDRYIVTVSMAYDASKRVKTAFSFSGN